MKRSLHSYGCLFGWFFVFILTACTAMSTGTPSQPSAIAPTAMPTLVSVPTQESAVVTSIPPAEQSIVVAFVQDGDIHLWDEGASQAKTVFSAGDVIAVWMSDDGQRIAFTRRSIVQRNDDEWFEQSSLWVVDSNGDNPREIVSADDLRQLLSAGES